MNCEVRKRKIEERPIININLSNSIINKAKTKQSHNLTDTQRI